jgi:hypothetical protein
MAPVHKMHMILVKLNWDNVAIVLVRARFTPESLYFE